MAGRALVAPGDCLGLLLTHRCGDGCDIARRPCVYAWQLSAWLLLCGVNTSTDILLSLYSEVPRPLSQCLENASSLALVYLCAS